VGACVQHPPVVKAVTVATYKPTVALACHRAGQALPLTAMAANTQVQHLVLHICRPGQRHRLRIVATRWCTVLAHCDGMPHLMPRCEMPCLWSRAFSPASWVRTCAHPQPAAGIQLCSQGSLVRRDSYTASCYTSAGPVTGERCCLVKMLPVQARFPSKL
jgi:hypothetical protein